MTEFFRTPMFGIFLTCLSWTVGVWAQKKTGWKLCYPLVVATVFAIAVLVLLKIPYSAYKVGGDIVTTMLASATAVLALNIYNQRKLLGKYFLPVVVGCSVGALTSLATITLLCKLMAVNSVITASLFPKSVTTAIAVAISENGGGIQSITRVAEKLVPIMGNNHRIRQAGTNVKQAFFPVVDIPGCVNPYMPLIGNMNKYKFFKF